MQPRPRFPGHHNGSASHQKIWLAAAVIFLVPFLSLAEAKQPGAAAGAAGQAVPPPPHQRLVNDVAPEHHHHDPHHDTRGSQPVPDGGLIQNLAVTRIDDADARLETPAVPIKERVKRDFVDSTPHNPRPIPPKQQHAARSSSSRGKPNVESLHQNKGSKQQQQQSQSGFAKHYDDNSDPVLIPDDASALATLAPAHAVRAPHPSRHLSTGTTPRGSAGLISPQVARSLEDWEVEDFVLLATVDGDLYANDRKTLKERWHLEVDQPMVETKHYRTNSSILDDDYDPIDHYIWAVEPTRDGGLFLWMPDSDAGLVRTGFTMKALVEDLAPFADEEFSVVYTGDKKTTLITLDAATGKVLKWFGSGGSHVNEAESCSRPTTLQNMDPEECSTTGTITLGRTEYTVGIQRRDGPPIATLKYSEWGPNNYDADLLHQYHASKDNRYFASQYDGNVYAFDPPERPKPRTVEKFTTPVARVFDVCRPWDAPLDSNPELVVLPQPPMPSRDEEIERSRSQSIFLNQTSTGSWYVMSGRSYPLIIDAPTAQVSRSDWSYYGAPSNDKDYNKLIQALIGNHRVEPVRTPDRERPSLPAGSGDDFFDPEHEKLIPVYVPKSEVKDEDGLMEKFKSFPQKAVASVVDLFRNPAMILVIALMIFTNQRSLRRSYHNFKEKGIDGVAWQVRKALAGTGAESVVAKEDASSARVDSTPAPSASPEQATALVEEQEVAKAVPSPPADEHQAVGSGQEGGADAKVQAGETPVGDGGDVSAGAGNDALNDTPKKKKAHRGRRGGVKHRKGKAKDSSSPEGLAPEAVDEAVSAAKRIVAKSAGQVIRQEPDPVTAPWDSTAVSAQIQRVGNLEVNLDQQLGTGSNGTLVFAGKFDGRDVAVKRLLNSFTGLAERETQLLRESDDHPNVIRYYHMIEQGEFLYIALERCGASLANVIEKPQAFRELANAGRQDLPAVLYQITSGINHLHSLRIVHRDLKPQNILVSMGKDGKPRLLVSDFGLCKKLENEQSSFGATTGRAAGTSGWRAPELLIDDDDRDNSIVETDTQSGSGSILLNDGTILGGKRATRSIDIFSLGLVYYYVLTNGSHPFDCGDKFMREVNIRRGNYNLDQLDSLGDWAFEAKNLIGSMIHSDPKRRPLANDIMAHPFFWPAKKRLAFLCDVSDHFEKEQRDPPSGPLQHLEGFAPEIIHGDFLKALPREFVDSLGKQRKYTGTRLLDLLRALRNKRNHYEDMSDSLKRSVGSLPEGYLCFWTTRFPSLLIHCWDIVYNLEWENTDRFREYYQPAGL